METGETNTSRWFRRDLNPPPIFVYPSDPESKTHFKETYDVTRVLLEATNTLKTLDQLEVDFSVLKKMMFKFGAVLRKHKQFKAMQQFYRCIRSFFELDMHKIYSNVQNVCPKFSENSNCLGSSCNLPSKQMWQYLLVRTYCMVYLLLQACSYGKCALQYSFEKLQIGLFIPSNVIITGCISRLWVLCAVLAGKAVEWYDVFYPWLEKLTSSQMEWLNSSECLPPSLSASLGQTLKQLQTNVGLQQVNLSLVTDKRAAARQREQNAAEQKTEEMKIPHRLTEDIGVMVMRTNTNKNARENAVEKSNPNVNQPLVFTQRKQLKRWLKKENDLREAGAAQHSAKVSHKQWLGLLKFVRDSQNLSIHTASRVIVGWLKKPKLCAKKFRLHHLSVIDDFLDSSTKTQKTAAKKENKLNSRKIAQSNLSKKNKLKQPNTTGESPEVQNRASKEKGQSALKTAELKHSKKQKIKKAGPSVVKNVCRPIISDKKSVHLRQKQNNKKKSRDGSTDSNTQLNNDIDSIFSIFD